MHFLSVFTDRVPQPSATVKVVPFYQMCGRIVYLRVAFPRHIAKICEKFVNFKRNFLQVLPAVHDFQAFSFCATQSFSNPGFEIQIQNVTDCKLLQKMQLIPSPLRLVQTAHCPCQKGPHSDQSTFYSSAPSSEKLDRTTVPTARSTVPVGHTCTEDLPCQAGPLSPKHVLQFLYHILKTTHVGQDHSLGT